MTIWAMLIIVMGIDGSIDVRINFPIDSKYNTQEICEKHGALVAAQIQQSNKTEIRVGWMCKLLDYNRIEKALPPKI